MTGTPGDHSSTDDRDGLTPIHKPIHCVATNNTGDGEDELDQYAIDHFLDTLTELALTIAHRRLEMAE